MSLSLIQNSHAIVPLNTARFLGKNGVEPYTYSVIPGGAGGTIDASTGVYTAPSGYGSDTIQVEDDIGATATAPIMVGSALLLLCDIIKTEMGLDDEQVYLWNSKWFIPKDSRLYIPVGILNCKPFANTNFQDGAGSDLVSQQSTNFAAQITIDILSRNLDAVNRKEEVLMALKSNYAEFQQTLNGFFIAPIPLTFVNLTKEDGAAILYRFNITVNMQYAIRKSTDVPYYDDFSHAETVKQ